MESKTKSKSFTYDVSVVWNTERKGVRSAEGKPSVEVATPPEFKGHPGIWSPEDLFVSSVNVCTMCTFVGIALRKNLPFLEYRSNARGLLEVVDGKYRFTHILIEPVVRLAAGTDVEAVRTALHEAEANCLVANSITAKVEMKEQILIGASEES